MNKKTPIAFKSNYKSSSNVSNYKTQNLTKTRRKKHPNFSGQSPQISSSVEMNSVEINQDENNETFSNKKIVEEFHTMPCLLYKHGKCNKSNFECYNAHDFINTRRKPKLNLNGSWNYDYKICNNIENNNKCINSQNCKFSHSFDEKLYHPDLFRKTICNEFFQNKKCNRKEFCFGVHPPNEFSKLSKNDFLSNSKLNKSSNDTYQATVYNATTDSNFYMFEYKTKPCQNVPCNNLRCCTFYHHDQERRRSPKDFKYSAEPCSNVKILSSSNIVGKWREPSRCQKLVLCEYSHTLLEQMYHPHIYKTSLCSNYSENNDFEQKKQVCLWGNLCTHAHGKKDLRQRTDQSKIFDFAEFEKNKTSQKISPKKNFKSNKNNASKIIKPPMIASKPPEIRKTFEMSFSDALKCNSSEFNKKSPKKEILNPQNKNLTNQSFSNSNQNELKLSNKTPSNSAINQQQNLKNNQNLTISSNFPNQYMQKNPENSSKIADLYSIYAKNENLSHFDNQKVANFNEIDKNNQFFSNFSQNQPNFPEISQNSQNFNCFDQNLANFSRISKNLANFNKKIANFSNFNENLANIKKLNKKSNEMAENESKVLDVKKYFSPIIGPNNTAILTEPNISPLKNFNNSGKNDFENHSNMSKISLKNNQNDAKDSFEKNYENPKNNLENSLNNSLKDSLKNDFQNRFSNFSNLSNFSNEKDDIEKYENMNFQSPKNNYYENGQQKWVEKVDGNLAEKLEENLAKNLDQNRKNDIKNIQNFIKSEKNSQKIEKFEKNEKIDKNSQKNEKKLKKSKNFAKNNNKKIPFKSISSPWQEFTETVPEEISPKQLKDFSLQNFRHFDKNNSSDFQENFEKMIKIEKLKKFKNFSGEESSDDQFENFKNYQKNDNFFDKNDLNFEKMGKNDKFFDKMKNDKFFEKNDQNFEKMEKNDQNFEKMEKNEKNFEKTVKIEKGLSLLSRPLMIVQDSPMYALGGIEENFSPKAEGLVKDYKKLFVGLRKKYTCPLCVSASARRDTAILPCGHFFCSSCALEVVQKDCPRCGIKCLKVLALKFD